MGDWLDPSDLEPWYPDLDPAKAEAMIADAEALAKVIAPCITADDFAYNDAVTAILRNVVLRWIEAGSGAVSSRQQSAGAFQVTQSFDTKERRGLFWPSEITALQELCQTSTQRAYTIDTTPRGAGGYPLEGAVVNADTPSAEPDGEWSDQEITWSGWRRS